MLTKILAASNLLPLVSQAIDAGTLFTKTGRANVNVIRGIVAKATSVAKDGRKVNTLAAIAAFKGWEDFAKMSLRSDTRFTDMVQDDILPLVREAFPELSWENETTYSRKGRSALDLSGIDFG